MKRILLGLIVALLLVLCACGQTEAPEPTQAPTITEEATTLGEAIESIYYKTAARIHPDMPEFTFVLVGEWTRTYSRSNITGEIDRDASYMRESTNVREILINEVDGPFRQWLDGFETFQSGKEEPYGFYLEDFNNDGYLDISLYYRPGAVDHHRLFWLWDTKQEKFVRNEQLQELGTEWQFFNLDEDGRIKLFSRSGGGIVWSAAWYEYRNNKFVLVESEDGEIIFEDGNREKEPVGRHVIIKKLVNGKMKTVSDTTESWEEYIQ